MKAMIWKELHENAKWGVLAAIGLGIIYAYFLSQSVSVTNDSYVGYVYSGDLLPTLFTAPIVGLLLGLLQILPELRRDQWAFLVHRPFSQASIFCAKAVSGAAIYLAATLTPFAIAMFWLATSSSVKFPFDWHFMLAGGADIACGLIFYLAGLLTALRPARWYGSRATVIGTAVLGLLLMVQMTEFRDALMVGMGFGVVLSLAAVGNFISKGHYQRQPKFSQIALGIALFTGNAVACCAIIAFFAILISSQSPRSSTSSTRYEIDKLGRVLLVSSTGGNIENMRTLDGKSIPVPPLRPTERYHRSPFLTKEPVLNSEKQSTPSFRSPFRYLRVLTRANSSEDRVRWYYHAPEALVGLYSIPDSRWEGYLTPTGFVPYETQGSSGKIARFKGEMLNWRSLYATRVLAFRNGVYVCDFANRRIVKIVEAEPNDPILQADELFDGNNYQRLPGVIVVVTKNWIRGFSPEGKRLFATPVEYRDRGYSHFWISMAPKRDRWYIWYQPPISTGNEQPLPAYITAVERGKSAITRYTLPPLSSQRLASDRNSALIGLLFGPGFIICLALAPGSGIPGILALLFGWSILASLISAIATYFIGRRYGFSKAVLWGWVLGVFVLGPFGLLTLLSLRAWPARKECHSCEKQRVVNQEQCESCGAGWPESVRDGTEIFEEIGQRTA